MIKTSINSKKDGSPLHFPFLVMEAKAENSHEGFDYAEVKSGLPIIAALKCQYEMMKIAANTVEVPGGPLVWFLANRGEHWRIYAAYVVEDQDQEPSFVGIFSRIKTESNNASGSSPSGEGQLRDGIKHLNFCSLWMR
jgi:hypothetical protein